MNSSAPVPIAVFLSNFEPGGTERQMIELIRRLDRSRFEVHVACFQPGGAWRALVEERAQSIAAFPIRRFHSAEAFRQAACFQRWCRERNIAIVQASDLYGNIFALPAAAAARVPVRVGSRRGMNAERGPAHVALQRLAFSFAHRIVANSLAAARRLRNEGVARQRILIVPNGLDSRDFAAIPALDGLRTPKVVVSVGGLRAEKGHRFLVEAAPSVVARHPEVEFRLIGDGPEEARLRKMAEERGVGGAVRFLGYTRNVAASLGQAGVFVLPSLTEAFPNALMEAMAAARAVVASSVGGVGELVEDGVNGLLVPPGDPAKLASAISRIFDDAKLARRLGNRARADVSERYSFERMVSAFDDLYRAELGRVAARRGWPAPAPAR